MRTIDYNLIKQTVCDLAIKANTKLRPDVLAALKQAYWKEKSNRAKSLLSRIIENSAIAKKENLAICQDTGLPFVFVEIGNNIVVSGKGIEDAILEGVKLGYKKGNFRNSVIKDPLRLKQEKSYFGPAVIHYEYNNSSKLKITVLPKGFGSENKSQIKMFNPTASLKEIKSFIVKTVRDAGPDACPPYIVGVGIGGTADYAMFLAKKALLKKVHMCTGALVHQLDNIRELESDLLSKINKLNIGPMGLGGKITALAVNIETYPTHIAGLPVAVNISCHALRSATKIL